MQHRLRGLAALLGTAGLISVVVPQVAGARSGADFVDGSGAARGTTIRLAPRTGGLTFAVATGDSLASYQGTEGRSQATALDLGIFGFLLTTVSACGQQPPFKQDQLPQPVQANSSHGPTSATHSFAGQDIARGGTETAVAHPDTSTADASAATLDIPGVLTVGAAVSHAETRLVPGLRRVAHADASIASVDLAGGAVQLLGLHWSVTQHTGDHPLHQGTFHIADIRIGGADLPTDALNGLTGAGSGSGGQGGGFNLDQANQVLEQFGMHLSPPLTRTLTDGTVEVGPLRISMGGSTRLSGPLGQALAATQPGRDAILGALKGDPSNCNDPRSGLGPLANAAFLVADITFGGLTGTGGMDIELGGVHAVTEGIAYRNPFGDFLPPPALGDTSVSDTTPAEPGTPAVPPAPATVPPPPATQVITPATAGRTFTSCLTTSPFGHPGCSGRDLARLAGAVGLGIALVLFVGDAVLVFRRRRIGEVAS